MFDDPGALSSFLSPSLCNLHPLVLHGDVVNFESYPSALMILGLGFSHSFGQFPIWCMTQFQDEFRSLSGPVPEILTACRMLQILIAWCQNEAEIRGFPTMCIIGGVNIVKIGEKHDFVQILGLKTPISSDRNFEHLTSEGSVA